MSDSDNAIAVSDHCTERFLSNTKPNPTARDGSHVTLVASQFLLPAHAARKDEHTMAHSSRPAKNSYKASASGAASLSHAQKQPTAMATSSRAPPPLLLLLCLVLLLVVAPAAAAAAAGCDCGANNAGAELAGEEEEGTAAAAAALRLKFTAIASILASGAAGVLVPVLGRSWALLRADGDVFFAVKAFAAGVILATGMVHILPAAFDALASASRFPFAGLVAMAAAMLTMVVDSLAAGYYRRSHFRKPRPVDDDGRAAAGAGAGEDEEERHAGHLHVHTHATHGHAHGHVHSHGHGHGGADSPEEASAAETIRHRVVSQVLELGILVHSVIIGVSLGASLRPTTIRPLVGALSFHQFFEGIGLGGCIVQAKFKAKATVLMATFFSFTAPIGIALGIAITSSYSKHSSTALVVEGVFNSAAAGILIYMSLVDLLAADFNNPKLQTNTKLQLATYLALFLGAGLMSLLAKWA